MKAKMAIAFLIGWCMAQTVGLIGLRAGDRDGWTRWDINEAIRLLEKIDSHLVR